MFIRIGTQLKSLLSSFFVWDWETTIKLMNQGLRPLKNKLARIFSAVTKNNWIYCESSRWYLFQYYGYES